jgi:hypothetical protein
MDTAMEEALPEDVDDDALYVQMPHKNELDLGRALVLDFAREHLADFYETVEAYFKKRGAYANFKNLLQQHNQLQAWYDYEAQATESALREWCSDNDFLLNVWPFVKS